MAVSGDLLVAITRSLLLASGEWRPGMLLDIFQCTTPPPAPAHRINQSKMSMVVPLHAALVLESPLF